MTASTPAWILIVDDDPLSRTLLADVLEDAGYSVAAAGDGLQALAIMARQSFDLVMLDVQMPNMDGFALARAIRSDVRNQGLPLLAITALTRPEDAIRILEVGCDAYLGKPIDIVEVRELVSEILAHGRETA